MTLEHGLELLAGRRTWEAENGPSPKRVRKKVPAKPKKGYTPPALTNECCEESRREKSGNRKS